MPKKRATIYVDEEVWEAVRKSTDSVSRLVNRKLAEWLGSSELELEELYEQRDDLRSQLKATESAIKEKHRERSDRARKKAEVRKRLSELYFGKQETSLETISKNLASDLGMPIDEVNEWIEEIIEEHEAEKEERRRKWGLKKEGE